MNPGHIRSWLRGPVVAVATPFKEDFSLDLDALRNNIRFMIRGGIKTGQGALLVAAAGGEHPLLNPQERMDIMNASVEAAAGEVPVLSSIQHTDMRVIVQLARHASKVGILGAQLSPTYYYLPSEGDVLRLFQHVASESDVTLMIYHTWRRSFSMSLNLLEQLAEIPSVRAVKWSARNDRPFARESRGSQNRWWLWTTMTTTYGHISLDAPRSSHTSVPSGLSISCAFGIC